jgi:outer membrane immunogenic protein
VLFYGTAGLAYGQIDSISTLPGSLKQSSYKPGWTVGGGIESIVAGNWSVRLEYLYIDLGRDRGTDPSSVTSVVVTPLSFLTGGNTLVSGFNSHVTDNVVRIGFNYHWGGPAIGKY